MDQNAKRTRKPASASRKSKTSRPNNKANEPRRPKREFARRGKPFHPYSNSSAMQSQVAVAGNEEFATMSAVDEEPQQVHELPAKNGHANDAEHGENGVEQAADMDTSKDDIYEELFGDVQAASGKKKKRSKPCPKSRKLKGEPSVSNGNGIEGDHAEEEESAAESGTKSKEIEEVLADFEDDDSEVNGATSEVTEKLKTIIEDSRDEDEVLVNNASDEQGETEQMEETDEGEAADPVEPYHVEYPESEKSEADQINITASAFLNDPPEEIINPDDLFAASVSNESFETTTEATPPIVRRSTRLNAGTPREVYDKAPFVRYISSASARRPLHDAMLSYPTRIGSVAGPSSSSSIFNFLGLASRKDDGSTGTKRKADWEETEEQQTSKKVKSSSGFFSRLTSPVLNRFRGVSYRSKPVEKVEIVDSCVPDAADVSSTEDEGEVVIGKEELPVISTAEPANQNWCLLM